MEKEKSKKIKQFEFNPADYGYMDDMPLEGWIWEFLRRSEVYRQRFAESEKSLNEIDNELYRKKGVHPYLPSKNGLNSDYYLNFKWENSDVISSIARPKSKYIHLDKTNIPVWGTEPVKARLYGEYKKERLKNKDIFSEVESLYEERYKNKSVIKDSSNYFTDVSSYFTDYYHDLATDETLAKLLLHELAIATPDDTIYVGISRKAKIKDIERYLLPTLKKYLQPYKPKIRDDRWKYYLIVFDIKENYPGISFEDISDKLSNTYPYIKTTKIKKGKKVKTNVEGYNYFTPKNCENFYKQALSLINGEYKKYLYL